MNANNILKSRKIISNLEKDECIELAKEVLRLTSAEDVEKVLKDFVERK